MSLPNFTMTELILLEVALDDFIVVSGERIETETDTRIYPFTHAVTFRLSPHAAARLGQDIITVSEASILIDCELPKATQLPAVRDTHRDERQAVEVSVDAFRNTNSGTTDTF